MLWSYIVGYRILWPTMGSRTRCNSLINTSTKYKSGSDHVKARWNIWSMFTGSMFGHLVTVDCPLSGLTDWINSSVHAQQVPHKSPREINGLTGNIQQEMSLWWILLLLLFWPPTTFVDVPLIWVEQYCNVLAPTAPLGFEPGLIAHSELRASDLTNSAKGSDSLARGQ